MCMRCRWAVHFRTQLGSPVSSTTTPILVHQLIPYSKERGYHIVGGICIALIGLIITVAAEQSKTKYGGLCVLLFGSVSSPSWNLSPVLLQLQDMSCSPT